MRSFLMFGSVATAVVVLSGCLAQVQQARVVAAHVQGLQTATAQQDAAAGGSVAADTSAPTAPSASAAPAAGLLATQIGARLGLPMGAIMGAAQAASATPAAASISGTDAATSAATPAAAPRVSNQTEASIVVAPNREIEAQQFDLLRTRTLEIARVSACAREDGRALGRFAHQNASINSINNSQGPLQRMRNHPVAECVRIERVSFVRSSRHAVTARVRYVSEQSGEAAVGIYRLRTEDGQWRLLAREAQ